MIKSTAIFFYVVFGVGVIGIAVRATRAAMLVMVPYVLLVCAVLLLFTILRGLRRTDTSKFIGWCSLVFLATVFLEALGVNYGLVFGQYRYSDVLGIKVWGVPLIIGLNWLTVILGSISLLKKIAHRTFFFALEQGFLRSYSIICLSRLRYSWISGDGKGLSRAELYCMVLYCRAVCSCVQVHKGFFRRAPGQVVIGCANAIFNRYTDIDVY